MFHFYCRLYQELSYLSNFRELNLPKQTNGFDILALNNLDPKQTNDFDVLAINNLDPSKASLKTNRYANNNSVQKMHLQLVVSTINLL